MRTLRRRKQPVTGEGHNAEARFGIGKCLSKLSVMFCRNVKIIHGAGDVEITIGVKAFHKSESLMAQVTFNLEISFKTIA